MNPELQSLAWLFLRLGSLSFGGPAAHVAMMEEEVVRRRKWLSHEEFLDLLGAAQLIPGPNSTELAIHIGHRRAGWPGLCVAGICFIAPAALMVSALGWIYVRWGALPQMQHLLYGIKPVIIAVVVQALMGLFKSAVKSKALAALGLGSVILNLFGVHELLILAVSAFVALALKRSGLALSKGGWFLGLGGVTGGLATAVPFHVTTLFLFFLKVGSVLFGSGYVLLAFLRADLVDRWGWLTEAQLLDAIAVGQVTPGPVLTTATFIGFILGGAGGALAATVGIFLPGFVFVALTAPWISRLRQSPVLGAALDGVNVASLALMCVVTWELGRSAVVDVWTIALATVSAVLLIRFRWSSALLVVLGAAFGFVSSLLASHV